MKIKIIHIITMLELGGAQENTLFTLKKLNREVFAPVLISGTGGILDEEAGTIEGVKTYFIPELVREINPLKDLIALFKITKILSLEKQLGSQQSAVSSQFSELKAQNSEHRIKQSAICNLQSEIPN